MCSEDRNVIVNLCSMFLSNTFRDPDNVTAFLLLQFKVRIEHTKMELLEESMDVQPNLQLTNTCYWYALGLNLGFCSGGGEKKCSSIKISWQWTGKCRDQSYFTSRFYSSMSSTTKQTTQNLNKIWTWTSQNTTSNLYPCISKDELNLVCKKKTSKSTIHILSHPSVNNWSKQHAE